MAHRCSYAETRGRARGRGSPVDRHARETTRRMLGDPADGFARHARIIHPGALSSADDAIYRNRPRRDSAPECTSMNEPSRLAPRAAEITSAECISCLTLFRTALNALNRN